MAVAKTDPPVKLLLIAFAGLWAYGWVPNFILMEQVGRVFGENFLARTSSSTFLSHSAAAALIGLTVLALLSAILVATRRPVVSVWYPAILIAPWALIFVGYSVFGEGGFAYREIVYPLLVIAAYLARPGVSEICRFIARLAIVSAVIALVMAFTMQSIAFMPGWWNDEKAIFGDSILAGPYAHSNQIGTALALALPFIYMSYTAWRRITYLALTIATVLWSSSRTSLVAIFTVSAVLLVITWARPIRAKLSLLKIAICALVFTALALPVLTSDPLAYTRRGLVWQQSLYFWSLSPLTGWGPQVLKDRNPLTQAVGGYPIHSHNIWLTFAVMGGILALIPVAISLVLIFRRASQMYSMGEARPLFFLAILSAVGIAEDPIRALGISPMAYVAWGGLMLVMCRTEDAATSDSGAGNRGRATGRISGRYVDSVRR